MLAMGSTRLKGHLSWTRGLPSQNRCMRRTAALVAAWLVVGAAAVAAATAGVSLVGRQVTDSRPEPLSSAEVQQELAALPSTSSTSVGQQQPPGTTAGSGGVSSTSTTQPRSGPTEAVATTTTAPTAPPPTAPPGETRTYALVGGTATIRFSPAGAAVVTATPNAGFDVEVEPENGNGVKVEFESDGHRSRVTAWWDGGPRDDLREEPDR